MKTLRLTTSFSGGEITPELYGRMDLDKYQVGVETMRNFIAMPYGGATKRPGFAYVNRVGDIAKAVRLIPFSYSADQTMVLEFGDEYLRFHTQGETLLETALNLTNATAANPCVLTYTGTDPTGFANGDEVYVKSIVGSMGDLLNNRYFIVAAVNTGANTFSLKDLDGNAIDTTGLTYTSGGTFARVYEITTPYDEADLFDLHYTQNGDVLTIVHPDYAPREIGRYGATDWRISSLTFAPDTSPPSTVSAAATSGSGSIEYVYGVSAVSKATKKESAVQIMATGTSKNLTGVSVYVPYGRTRPKGIFDLSSTAGLKVGQIIGPVTGVTGVTGVNGLSYVIRSVVSSTRLYVDFADGRSVTPRAWTGSWISGGSFWLPTLTNDLSTAGNINTVTWAAVDDAARYKVYKQDANGKMLGYIGETEKLEFIDDNITPDLARTPPQSVDPFVLSDDFPAAVCFYEQRRVLGGTNDNPQYLWFTRAGAETDMSASFPANDDDAFTVRIASRENNAIRHVVALYDLIALTGGSEFRLSPSSGDEPLTPFNVNPRPLSYCGASNVQPAVTQSSVLFVAASGGHVYELAPSSEMARQYSVDDISIMAPHLFDGYDIVDVAFQRSPVPVLWCVRSDGKMVSLTYVPAQRVIAWHRHDTNGTFESVCCVREGKEDRVYAVVKRNINNQNVRHVERMAELRTPSNTGSFYVDAGVSYSGAAVTELGNLWHLEGEEVSILADGADHPPRTVTDGAIALDQEASVVHIGLQYHADLKTLPPTLQQMQAAGITDPKNVNAVYFRVYNSRGLEVGTDFDNLYENKERTTEPYGAAPALQSEIVEVPIDGDWNLDGQVCVRSSAPLPLTILSMVLDVTTGG